MKKRAEKVSLPRLKPRNLIHLGMMSKRCERHEKDEGALRRAEKMKVAKLIGSTYQKIIFCYVLLLGPRSVN